MDKNVCILIVEDDDAMRESCAKLFDLEGYETAQALSAAEALEQIKKRNDIDIVLTDIKMPGIDGLALLREIKLLNRSLAVVLMTGYGSIKNAVEAMRHGAADYITKPFDTTELLMTIGKIVQLSGLQQEVSRLRSELRDKYRFDNIIGDSPRMRLVYEKIEAASKTNSTTLICGESGTGKELVARAIHYNGPRADKPFVPVNCPAIPKELIESELFGHQKGAFTGAFANATGLFPSAHGGTIFLDEILDMPYGTQAKLLRVLQERRVRAVGGTREVPVDVRVIAATNQDLKEAVQKRKFRRDLYYRLDVIRIDVPPLSAHRDDISALVSHFIGKLHKVSQRNVEGISDDALRALSRYHWPGNVRELESVVENAIALGKSDVICRSDLPPHILEPAEETVPTRFGDEERLPTLSQSERELVLRALTTTEGNKTRAAALLGISRPRLYNLIRRYNI